MGRRGCTSPARYPQSDRGPRARPFWGQNSLFTATAIRRTGAGIACWVDSVLASTIESSRQCIGGRAKLCIHATADNARRHVRGRQQTSRGPREQWSRMLDMARLIAFRGNVTRSWTIRKLCLLAVPPSGSPWPPIVLFMHVGGAV